MEYQSLTPNIGVKNVNETVKFYTETLGFQQIMSVPETGELAWAMVGSGNVFIAFQETQNLREEYPALKDKPQNATLTFYIKLKGMKTLYDKLKNTEYLAKALHKTFYGADEFAIYDNNGFILTITEDAE
ncbi:VOC family protein [Viscerimonas tarda]